MQKVEQVQISSTGTGMVRLMFNGRVVGFVADFNYARHRAKELERDLSRLQKIAQQGASL